MLHRDGWLFPGQHAVKPISTRQLYRVVFEAAHAAEITRRLGLLRLRHSFAPHLLEDGLDIRVNSRTTELMADCALLGMTTTTTVAGLY